MLVLIVTLVLLVFVFLLSVRLFPVKELSELKSNSFAMVVFIAIMVGTTGVAYVWLVYEPERLERLDQFEALLPDVQILLESNEASEGIKALDAASFVSLLGYYGQAYPADGRVWQKLAVVLINLQQPDSALKAVRRYLRLTPDDLQARQLEVQLLTSLVRNQQGISPRQLRHALEMLIARADLTPEDRLYVASLAEEFGFHVLAVEVWQAMLDADKRDDTQLTPQALQGRQLVQTMLARSLEQLNASEASVSETAVTSPPSQEQAHDDLAIRIQGISFEISLDEGAKAALNTYVKEYPGQPFHVWLSLSRGGPPIAARLVWFENTDQLLSSNALQFSADDFVMLPSDPVSNAALRAILVLSPSKSDPLVARQSPWQATVDLNLTYQLDQNLELLVKSVLVE